LTSLRAGPIRTEFWTETSPDKDGQLQTIEAAAELWTEAFQADLDADAQLHIPARDKPYCLDGPIVLKSGQKLTADAKAEIRLKPGSNTCMVRNVTMRQSKPFTIHLGNIRDFTIDGLTLERHGRDGVHGDGPASDGIIRNVSGDSHDDPISLTAWDWKQYSASFGPIHHLTIEHNTGAPEDKRGTDAIRLLPGIKRFSDGTTLNCPIHDITLRHMTDSRDFKLYDQPNLEAGRANDFSDGIGTLKNITFVNLTFNRPGSIQVHANTDGLTLRGTKLLFALPADYHLLELGPKSATHKGAPGTDPAKWTEIFSPDLDCTVRNLAVTGVRTRDSQIDPPIEQVVKVIEQEPNPDYPKTTPKCGTGNGVWVR
jgi:hypothetical protein